MAQHDMNIANQGFPAFRSDLNNALSAIQTTHSGTSRPTGAVAGQIWLDTTTATSPTLKYYDGADDISLATIDHTANTVNWLDSTVSITGLSTTATGTVLTLSDTASTSTVNLIIDNQKEVRFRETTGNGTNYIGLKAPASVSADLTFTLPATDGTAGQVLQTNGSGVLSFATVGGLAWQSVVTASTLTAVAGRGYWIDTTSNACTVTLPASATNGDTIVLADYARKWGTNAVTINTNSLKFQGNTSPNPVYNTNGQSVTLIYSGATQGWIPTVDDDVTFETPQPYTVDFLVIAGGASGASGTVDAFTRTGGGGGAGGYRNSYSTETSGGGGSSEASLSFSTGTVYTITVGAGGVGTTGASQGGNVGGSSSISGSGITTITSSGGGSGGRGLNPNGDAGVSGGSGGGGGSSSGTAGAGGAGTANQGYAGGSGGQNPVLGGGGGGGASAVGGNGGGTSPDIYMGGAGGAGLASSITGSSVTRAGGGGGASYNNYQASGGSGGGGNGASFTTLAASGTANTGGGGGGAGDSNAAPNFLATSGAGGSGVVILRMATANYSGTTTGSPTVSTSGSDTILVYNGSGTYTG
jgi:hypothetical protein